MTKPQPTQPIVVKKTDTELLKEMIKAQRALGATVSENIYDSKEYQWDSGELIRLDWSGKGLTGSISFSEFESLNELICYENQLTSLDVTGCAKMEYLYCNDNQLSSLDVTVNTALTELKCDDGVEINGR